MTLQSMKLLAETVCLLAVAASAVYVAHDLHQTSLETQAALRAATQVEMGMQSTLAEVNRPCGVKGKPCGTLAEVNRAAVKLQDVTVTLQRQVGQSAELVDASAAAIQSAAADVHRVAGKASDLTVQATADLQTAKPLLESLRASSDASTRAVNDFDALVKSPDLVAALKHMDGMTASGDAILADGRKVTDKLSNDYLTPKPWYRRVWGFAGDLFDMGALAARHTP